MQAIHNYSLIKQLAENDLGRIYYALDENKKPYTLSVISDEYQLNPRFLLSLISDRNGNQFTHPHIAKIVDYGEIENQQYFVSHFLGSKTLASFLGQAVPVTFALDVVSQLASGLHYAFLKGYIHGNIRPENIFFDSYGNAVLSGLALVKKTLIDPDEREISRTETNESLPPDGSTNAKTNTKANTKANTKSNSYPPVSRYQSPETLSGLTNESSDLYSLGILLFELLTGERFSDRTYITDSGVKNVNELIPYLPVDNFGFQPVINKLLARNPKQRYQSGLELVDALNEYEARLEDAPEMIFSISFDDESAYINDEYPRLTEIRSNEVSTELTETEALVEDNEVKFADNLSSKNFFSKENQESVLEENREKEIKKGKKNHIEESVGEKSGGESIQAPMQVKKQMSEEGLDFDKKKTTSSLVIPELDFESDFHEFDKFDELDDIDEYRKEVRKKKSRIEVRELFSNANMFFTEYKYLTASLVLALLVAPLMFFIPAPYKADVMDTSDIASIEISPTLPVLLSKSSSVTANVIDKSTEGAIIGENVDKKVSGGSRSGLTSSDDPTIDNKVVSENLIFLDDEHTVVLDTENVLDTEKAVATEINREYKNASVFSDSANSTSPLLITEIDITNAKQFAIEIKGQIKLLLERADEYLLLLKFTTPKNNNAYAMYTQILQLDPDNKKAQDGITNIVESYGYMAQRQMNKKNYEKASIYIDKGLAIQSNNEWLNALQREVNDWQKVDDSEILSPATNASGAIAFDSALD
ncbi:MAG: serine/threonine protein kinase [Gammaproteobacteria bacterium]|nr:serine/threonine protein kinase [Gammaproteobacteria bacterium]